MRGPFLDELGLLSKEAHMMFRELPMIVGHYITEYSTKRQYRMAPHAER